MKIPLPRIITQDFWRKCVAIFFATLIWFSIKTQLHGSRTLTKLPVEIQYDPNEIVIEDTPLTVDVTVKGSPKRLENLGMSDIRVKVKVSSQIPSGIHFYNLDFTPKNVETPRGITVTGVMPKHFSLRVDKITERRNIPVRVRFEGDLPEGYKRTRVTILPSSVNIKGPSLILREVKELVTEPIPLDDTVVQDFEIDRNLQPIPKVEIMPPKVHVAVEISRHSSQKALQGLTMFLLANPDVRLQLKKPLPKAAVTLQGPKIVIEAMDASSVRPFIDISSIRNPGRYRRPVQVTIVGTPKVAHTYIHPANVEIELIEPRTAPAAPARPPAP